MKQRRVVSQKNLSPSRISRTRECRERAGLTVEEAARRVHCSVAYLRRLEKSGGVSYVMGQRLSLVYDCNPQAFLYD